MNKYSGNWYVSNDKCKDEKYGILEEENNKLMFKTQHRDKLFDTQFIGICDSRNVKVYTYGETDAYDDFGYYSVKKAVLHNNNDLDELSGDKIDNIISASFSFRGFSEWYGKHGLEVTNTKDLYFTVNQKKEDIFNIYEGKNFDIFIYFKKNYPPVTMDSIGNKITLENSPQIAIMYKSPVTDSELLSHIKIIYRFFALLIGRLGYIDDIWFKRQDKNISYQLLINEDITYNLNFRSRFLYGFRIDFEKIKDKFQTFFDKWLSFSTDELYAFLLNNYFNLYKNRTFILEDYFLTCCKFIEGYSIRKYGDINKEYLKSLEKKIRPLFQNDKDTNNPTQIKKSLTEIFAQENIRYNACDISRAIAYILVNHKSLENRLNELDSMYFGIIKSNEKGILGFPYDGNNLVNRIASTRNYFSHYKSDNTDILNIQQIYQCNKILLALILCILLIEIGFDKNDILEILKKDEEFWSIAANIKD